MSNFDEKTIERIKRLEREVERLRVWERPYTAWTIWTEKPSGWSNETRIARYALIGKTCVFTAYISGASSGSGAAIALPFTAANIGTGFGWGGTLAYAVDNGATLATAARWFITNNSGLLLFYPDMATGSWTASGTKTVLASGFYEVA